MLLIRSCPLPADALTQSYRACGAYVDCYCTEIPLAVSHAEFVEAFYTTALFKLERWILRAFISRPSSDAEAHQLAHGERDAFAAWSVEQRAPNQLLVTELTGRTRTWFMVDTLEGRTGTRLYFGSVVVPVLDRRTGQIGLGPVHGRLLGFHKLYSRMLLRAAARRLDRTISRDRAEEEARIRRSS